MIRLSRWFLWLAGLAAATILLAPLPRFAKSVVGLAALDALHLPFFFTLTHLAHRLFASAPPSRRLLGTVVSLLALAALSEALQGRFGRTPSLADLTNNILGIAIAAAMIKCPPPRTRRQITTLITAAAAALLVALAPAIQAARATFHRTENFPTLGDFESPLELHFWIAQGESPHSATRIKRSSLHPSSGKFSLEIRADSSPWAGVHHLSAPTDCSQYSHLRFTLSNPGKPFHLGIRIDTRSNSIPQRLSHEIEAMTGTQEYQIPIKQPAIGSTSPSPHPIPRKGALQLLQLTFHLGEAPESTNFFLDRVELIKLQ